MIKAPLVIGTPAISLTASFVVIKYLPYSCIIGLNLLNQLREWSINNELNVLKFNHSYLPVSCDPPHFNDINLILSRKQQLPPNQKVSVTATAKGLGLSAFRPVTIISVLVEGNQKHLENRLGVQTHPSLHLLEENNCTIPVTVVNNSSTPRTIGKGSKLGS